MAVPLVAYVSGSHDEHDRLLPPAIEGPKLGRRPLVRMMRAVVVKRQLDWIQEPRASGTLDGANSQL